MTARFAIAFLAGAVILLAACQPGSGPSVTAGVNKKGFRANYLVARTALEHGKYSKAERAYADLLKRSGPLEPRIRLEYAHALLRSGKFGRASDEARIAAAQMDGMGRAAALAVQATADQEIARQTINSGQATPAALQLLISARENFDKVLLKHPELDPIGALALRRKAIEVEISTLQ